MKQFQVFSKFNKFRKHRIIEENFNINYKDSISITEYVSKLNFSASVLIYTLLALLLNHSFINFKCISTPNHTSVLILLRLPKLCFSFLNHLWINPDVNKMHYKYDNVIFNNTITDLFYDS